MAPGRSPWRLRALRTVRAKITATAVAAVALVLAASAFGLVQAQERYLVRGIDEALVQRADNIEADVVDGAFGVRLPGEGDPEDSFLQVLAPDGTVVARTDNAAGLPAAVPPLVGADDVLVTTGGVLHRDDEFRVHARALHGGGATGGRPLTLVAGKNLDDVQESAEILTTSLAVSIPVVTAVLALLVWWLAGRVLRPVEAIRREVASIHGRELHRRVPVPASDDEVARLARTMNQMLDRLEEATERQRRFVADASHELRSPLTRLRAALEISLAHPDALSAEQLQHDLLAETVELQTLVDDLLFLARSDERVDAVAHRPVDLDDLVLLEARHLREKGSVRVDVGNVSGARVLGDQSELRRVVRNLAANAERHAASTVTFEAREQDGISELVVADDGPGIPPEHRQTVFKRFARLDAARSRDAGGAGLGLAIVHDIVRRHHGSVQVTDGDRGGARLVVRLPRVE